MRTLCAFVLTIAPLPSITDAGVTVYGDWPPTGFCNFTLPPIGRQGLPGPGCNDTTSGLDVPFGMSIQICEHDGAGSAGLGKCRWYLPGYQFVGDDMNDKGTTFVVERRMIGYLSSADYPAGINVGIIWKMDSNGGAGSVKIDYDGTWIRQSHLVQLPPSCPNPRITETTKNGSAALSYQIDGNQLNMQLRVRPRPLLGANNWIGVEITC